MILPLLITNLTRVCVLIFYAPEFCFSNQGLVCSSHSEGTKYLYSTWNILATTEVLSLVVYFEVLQREKSMKVLSHQNKAEVVRFTKQLPP